MPLVITLKPINSLGKFKLKFEQDHHVPTNLMQSFEFREIFLFSITSSLDDKVVYGVTKDKKR